MHVQLGLAAGVRKEGANGRDLVRADQLAEHGLNALGVAVLGADHELAAAQAAEHETGRAANEFVHGQLLQAVGQTVAVLQAQHEDAAQAAFPHDHGVSWSALRPR